MEMVRNVSLSDSFGQTVADLIIATKHSAIQTNPDNQLIADIDLSILGKPEDRFDEYERQIRKEYEWVPEAAFTTGRSTILESFLARANIYTTQFFQEMYEVQARRNITRSLARLRT